jgi:predicted RNase H-like HicB family nuclease
MTNCAKFPDRAAGVLENDGSSCYTGHMSISAYIQAAMASARIKPIEDKTYFGEIPGFQGVWANGKTAKKCREVLQEVLEDWIVLKLSSRESLPAVDGKKLTVPEPVRA